MAYQVFVSKVERVLPIEGKDRIQVAIVRGYSCIVSKSVNVGDLGVLFPEAGVISTELLAANNVFKDSTLNLDQTQKGYFESNGRVRTLKMSGARSEGFFTGVEFLNPFGDTSALKEDSDVTTFGGKTTASKYYSQATLTAMGSGSQKRKGKVSVHYPNFNEHVDTVQFRFAGNSIFEGDKITITEKVHGTSARFGWTLAIKLRTGLLGWVNNLFKREVFKPTQEVMFKVGTRRVILSDKSKNGFHGSEQFRFDVAGKWNEFQDKSKEEIWYGEIVGYVNGKSIMPTHDGSKATEEFIKEWGNGPVTYRYACSPDEFKFFLYRACAIVDGDAVDASHEELERISKVSGAMLPAKLHEEIFDGDMERLKALVSTLESGQSFEDHTHHREGVVIRVERAGVPPKFFKSKNFDFRLMEGIASETTVDIEDAGGVLEE